MTIAIDGLMTNLAALEAALRAEKMDAVANEVRRFIHGYHKALETPDAEPAAIDWAKFSAQLEVRAGAMARENASLPQAARNTPFGVMTGTATIILSMIAEALEVGRGEPPMEMVDALILRIQSDRGAFALAKLGLNTK